VFIVYAIAIGLVLGLVFGGSLDALGNLRFRWPWLAIGGLVVQIALFSDPVAGVIGGAGVPIYVASSVAVLIAVLRNIPLRGLILVAAGALSNLAAIVANGGYMPADPGALALAGLPPKAGFSNSITTGDPALRPLTDQFALPAWVPLANVFSVGDVLIALGMIVVIVVGMRRPKQPPEHSPSSVMPGA
jgi:hypothetical protein